ncbi:Hypothetical predicted protein [Paramuricea clavata]|uniref:Uncharacterized protein n=1 Tax=Paramuricea clavata TaxID=317549 RepID=A0A6S7JY87_PARCT|nr:Hypothetical predicted protein [Paramuricea clavata]
MDCINKIEIRLAEMRSSAQEFEKHLGVAAKFVQVELLIDELKDLHVHVNLYNMELKLESMPVIKKVTAVSTIQGVFNTKPVSKASLPETHKLLIILSTYAMSSANCRKDIQCHETCQDLAQITNVSRDAHKLHVCSNSQAKK